ncbi:MAG: peptidoglycan bridge formation glycyltransferase FemA/FemB family protein [Ignavibacteriales bacterium]|nr:peptidoglycan bridge formation glycyltransferase FemA/FemB family protein [Ignavibacteriales bacterium]
MFEFQPFITSGVSDETWDAFVEASDNGTMFHKRRFLSYHPKERFKDASVVVTKDSKIFAVLPAVIVQREDKLVLSSHSGASYGGFAYKDLNIQEAFDLVAGLLKYAKKMKCDAIQMTFAPMIYQSKYSNYFEFALFRNGFTYLKREISSVVPLNLTDDELLATYRPEARTSVKKAINQGVEIVETELFGDYYEILKKNLKMRHNVSPTHSLEELLKLKLLFPTKIRLMGAFKDNQLLAGVCNFSANKNVVLAFYISHDEQFQQYRPVNLLFFEIMKRYREEGYKYLDFGIFTVNMEPNWGLGRFKENFGARGLFRDTFYKEL